MKFLAHGDSLVSLRFRYKGGPEGIGSSNETEQNNTELSAETVLALGKLHAADAIIGQVRRGETDTEFSYEQWSDVHQLMLMVKNSVNGDLSRLSSDDQMIIERLEGDLAEAQQMLDEVDGVHLYGGGDEKGEIREVKDLLPGYGDSLPEIEDLKGSIEREANNLKSNIEGENLAASAVLERSDLANSVLQMAQASESGNSQKATEIGFKADIEKPLVQNTAGIAVSTTVGNLSQQLASLSSDTTHQLDVSQSTLAAQLEAAEAMSKFV